MIDRDVLRQLGWSDQLIDAVSRAAEPLRRSAEIGEITAPIVRVQAVSTTAIYAEAIANNTFRAFTVSSQNETKKSRRLAV